MPALEPREAVWRGLEQRLFAAPATAPAVGSGSWLRRLLSGKHWAGAVAGVFLCALVLRLQPGLIGLEQGSEALPASYVGLLTDAAGQPSVLASSRRQGRQLTVKMLRPIVVPAGSVAMLWALPKDGAAAFPIGVVPASGSAIIGLGAPSERLFSNVSRMAVSIEPGPAKADDRPQRRVRPDRALRQALVNPFLLNPFLVNLSLAARSGSLDASSEPGAP